MTFRARETFCKRNGLQRKFAVSDFKSIQRMRRKTDVDVVNVFPTMAAWLYLRFSISQDSSWRLRSEMRRKTASMPNRKALISPRCFLPNAFISPGERTTRGFQWSNDQSLTCHLGKLTVLLQQIIRSAL